MSGEACNLFDWAIRNGRDVKPLPPDPPKPPTLQERFEAFDRGNPHIYGAIKYKAEQWRQQGRKRISVKLIVELLRADRSVTTEGGDWKINNSFTAFYAKKLVAECPEFRGLVELRG